MELKDIIKICCNSTCDNCPFNNYISEIEDVECYFETLPGYWDEKEIERRLKNGKEEN